MPFPHSLVERATLYPLVQAFPSPSTLGEVVPHPPSLDGLFIYISLKGVPLPPTLVVLSTQQPLLQAFPSPRFLGGCCPSCLLWPACLFTVRVGSAPPHSLELRVPCPLCYVSFFFQLLAYYSVWVFFSFFPGCESVCPGGYADLFQGCLWEYHVPLSSPGSLLLPSRIGAGLWWHGSPPGFSI
jgi:hypothetical protein